MRILVGPLPLYSLCPFFHGNGDDPDKLGEVFNLEDSEEEPPKKRQEKKAAVVNPSTPKILRERAFETQVLRHEWHYYVFPCSFPIPVRGGFSLKQQGRQYRTIARGRNGIFNVSEVVTVLLNGYKRCLVSTGASLISTSQAVANTKIEFNATVLHLHFGSSSLKDLTGTYSQCDGL
ncbi:hypothetical protein B0H14DRAFT_2556125 [Mycena olivaceomarginata]|nr:hypothetical protein B0H14DRAFT_2556125 [Mycena olivaceomarginata]